MYRRRVPTERGMLCDGDWTGRVHSLNNSSMYYTPDNAKKRVLSDHPMRCQRLDVLSSLIELRLYTRACQPDIPLYCQSQNMTYRPFLSPSALAHSVARIDAVHDHRRNPLFLPRVPEGQLESGL